MCLAVAWLVLSPVAGASGAEVTTAPGEDAAAKIKALKPGDTLLFKAGQHKGSLTIAGLKGTAEAPITLKGEKGAEIVPTAQDGLLFWGGESTYVIVEGLKIENASRAGIIVSAGKHITIRDCRIGNNGKWGVQTTMSDSIIVENCELYGSKKEHGVYFSTTDHPVARGNRTHDNAGCGIHNNGDKSEGGDGMITGGLYENNVIYNCGKGGGAAINMDSVETSIVRNNLIYNNAAGGIVAFHGDGDHSGAGNCFYNNTVYFQKGAGRFGLKIADGAKDTGVKNNILICGRGPAMEIDADSNVGLVSDHNLLLRLGGGVPVAFGGKDLSLKEWQKAASQDAHSLSVDPQFAEAGKADFSGYAELRIIGRTGLP